MAGKTSARIAVMYNGVPKGLLSISERPSGDLIIHLRQNQLTGDNPRPFVESPGPKGEKIQTYRYTVHTSKDSAIGINTINLHRILHNDEKLLYVHRNRGLKKFGLFAPLYFRMCTTMEDASYDLEKGKSYISLGNTHLTGTLILGVYAGPSNGKFFAWESQQYGWLRLQLREFCVLILYSFLLAPATGWGLLSHVVSAENEITEGFNQDQCINLFKSQCYKFREKYVDVVMRYDELKEFRDTVSRIGFVRELDSANSILTALKLAQQQK